MSFARARITSVIAVLVVVAAIFATAAWAGTDVYLNHAVVGSVPAVSGTAYHYDNFMGSDSGYANLGIYLYNVDTGSTTCQDYVDGVPSVYRSCANQGTARCHTIDGQGQIYATCQTTS
jgi:hypothetical protein